MQTDLASGAATIHIPVSVSPARGGFQPDLALTYDSNGGSGAYGLGWHVAIPVVRRSDRRGVPRYVDDGAGADTFCLGDGQDLVPALVEQPPGTWRAAEQSGTHWGRKVPTTDPDDLLLLPVRTTASIATSTAQSDR